MSGITQTQDPKTAVSETAFIPDRLIIDLVETDFCPIESFPLKWRWTASRYNVLPGEGLARIRPLSEAKASELMRCVGPFYGSYASDLDPSLFEQVEMINTSVDSVEKREVAAWLQSRHRATFTEVAISWDEATAVVTDWQVFCKYWDDFCYPASDDVAVVPFNCSWALVYFHEEYFTFGKRRQ